MSLCIRPENCQYRAEGNAGVVISLIKERTVLKLKKQDNVCKLNTSADDVYKELESEIKVINNVFKPIVGESFINSPLIVFLKAEDIRLLNEAVSRFRPAHRKHKNVKEEDTYVHMLPDFCCLPESFNVVPTCGPVLSIEIKLKQGFMKDHDLSCFPQLSHHMCRFCMMQEYKLQRGAVSSKSGYCPTDLFSGCYNRMFHALQMLIKTPQNNLRIFKEQKLIYSEENKGNLCELLSDFISSTNNRLFDLLCDLVVQMLLKPFPFVKDMTLVPYQKNFSQTCIKSHNVCYEHDHCHELPQYCILERILRCQLLDDLNITDLYQLYLQIKESSLERCSDFIGCYSRSEIPPCIGKVEKTANESDYEYASRKVWEFLIALTMKDCSVMVTMQHLMPNSLNDAPILNVVFDMDGNPYLFSISVVDLDSKSLSKVDKVYNDWNCMLDALNLGHK